MVPAGRRRRSEAVPDTVHIVGGGATELVGEAVLAMQLECTAREFARSIRIHPTFSEAVVDAARDAEKWALYLPRR